MKTGPESRNGPPIEAHQTEQLAVLNGENISPMPNSSPDAEPELNLPKVISFDTLTRCGDEIWIENNGAIYRLRRTRQGKLILTK